MCCGGFERIVTDAQVARRLGVPRERVRELACLPGFPRSVGNIDAVPLWQWRDVQRWARTSAAGTGIELQLAAR
jgi:hypothetical protein